MRKIFVEINVHYDKDGNMKPISIEWEDGRIFAIDRILGVCRSASLKAGGQGIRYTCRINGQITYVFYEGPKWFVEGKE